MSIERCLILIELNELTPPLMERFIAAGDLPNFRRLREESLVFTTDAQESGENLNPWIQWLTVHTGLPYADHRVFRLGEGHRLLDAGRKTIGEVVSDTGRPVWLCGSMNVRCRTPLYGAFLPDPWATDTGPDPVELAPYFGFVRQHVLEHTNESVPLSLGEKLRFVSFMARRGLSAATVTAIGRQLLRERTGRERWKRVAILDALQWDVFHWYHSRLRPHFATFFSNSVAHLQHTHWREMDPQSFVMKPSPEEQAEYEDAIRFGYRANDELIGRFLKLADERTTLVFCSALSQQPCTRWEAAGGKRFYRPRQFEELLLLSGITAPHILSPVMSEEFQLTFEDEAAALDAEKRLRDLRVDDEDVLWVDRSGLEIYGGCRVHRELPTDAVLRSESSGRRLPFQNVFYMADSVKSGIHHPDGMLWIRLPERRHNVHPERVPLTAVAPTLLRILDIAPPAEMRTAALM